MLKLHIAQVIRLILLALFMLGQAGSGAYVNATSVGEAAEVSAVTSASQTSTTATSDKIVFVRPQPGTGGDSNVWIMDADGANQTQLTTYPGDDRLPELSPDGSRIAYMSVRNGQQQLWVMNSDGTNAVALPISGNTQSPSWSPDGTRISYGNDSADFWEIWAINSDGSNARRLTTHSGAAGRQAWSPDGQKLIYAVEPTARYFDLYTVSISGTNQALLVSASSGYSHHLPAWSPDGTQIATVRFPAGSTGLYDLWLMNANGTNGQVLASNIDSAGINNVAWSKDGNWLVFAKDGQVWRVKRDGTQLTQIINNGGWEPDTRSSTFTSGPLGDAIAFVRPIPNGISSPYSNIWIMNSDGTNQTQLTQAADYRNRAPALSPDGSKIIYQQFRYGANTLWVMNSDGSNLVQLPISGDSGGHPVWSPDGSKIAFSNVTQDFWEVWTANPDGTSAQRITTTPGASGESSWSPDGQKLVFSSQVGTGQVFDLYKVNSDGTGQTVFVSASSTGFSNQQATWSPDGTQIATFHWPAGGTGPYDLWLMNADGTNGRVLVPSIDDISTSRISWSKDGNWLVFTKGGQVWRVKRDGTQLTQIINNGGWEPHTSFTTYTSPAIGDAIVFVRPRPEMLGNADVWIMNGDGTNQTQLTTYSGEDRWPILSSEGNKVAYVSVRSNQYQLWVMNSDGTNQVQLPMTGNFQRMSWSPDGSQLAVTNDGVDFWEVWTVNANGANPTRITTHPGATGSPSWSPNGQKIVYSTYNNGNHDLYTINSNGTNSILLVSASATGASNHNPAWSPEGSEIATIHWSGSGPYHLWLMNADGSNGRVLVQNIESGPTNRISWSKDGNWLVFSKDGQIWRVKRDGTELTQIATNGGWEPDAGAATINPAPLGDAIAFARPQPSVTDNNVDANVWIMNWDGTGQTQLTTYSTTDRAPSLSPNGLKIAYQSWQNNRWTFWVMDRGGSNKVQLPFAGDSMGMTWSPDGSQIAFSNDTQDFWEVWITNADGTNARRLTTHSGAAGAPDWSPDGQKLLYVTEPTARYNDLYTINADGTNQTLFISASASGFSNHWPAWSPDGNEIATVRFRAGSTGPYTLWLMNSDGTNGRALVQNLDSVNYNRISWSKDGQWLYFGKDGQVWRVKRDGTQPTQIINNGGWEPSVAPGANSSPNPCVADIMLVMDRSTSMDDNGKFAAAKAAVSTFISLTTAPPNQVGLAAFASSASLPQGLTTDKALVITATNALTTAGGTRIDLGLQQARLELAGPRHDPGHKKVIVLLSDGQQNPAGSAPVLAEAAQAKAEGATIFTIGLGAGVDAALLQQIASQPSFYYFAPTGADLNAIYTQISTVLACTDIGGQVFLDQDYDGLYTAGADAPLANAMVNLNGGVVSQTLSSSAANGNYLFANIPPATYTLSLALASVPAGYIPTTPTTRTVALTSAADDLDNDFGVALDPDAPCLAGPLVYSNTFNSNASLSNWTTTITDTTPTGRAFLGQFGNQTTSLFVGGLPQHTSLTICFDLFAIRSWDGNTDIDPLNGGDVGPDVWTLGLNSGPTLLQTTFSNWPHQRQAYPGAYPLGDYAPRSSARDNNSLGYTYNSDPMSAVYRLQVTFPHSTSAALFDFAAAGLQSLADESWGIDNVQVKADYVVQTHYTYLPLAMKNWATGIVGRVTQNGAPVSGVPLELRYFNGSTWSTRASTATFGEGLYVFGNVPALLPGEKYYVRFLNSSETPGRLWLWHAPDITSYTAGSRRELATFDIADIVLTSPANETAVWLPFTFQWAPRPATPTDSYEFNLFDPSDNNPYFYTNPALGYVGYYTLNSLPPGFSTYWWYLWDVWVYSPDGGYGISFDARWTGFYNGGYGYTSDLNLSDWPAVPPRKERLER